MNVVTKIALLCVFLDENVQLVQSFTTLPTSNTLSAVAPLSSSFHDIAETNNDNCNRRKENGLNKEQVSVASKSAMSILLSLNMLLVTPLPSIAEEYEAPTLFTGESTEVS